MKKKNLRRLIVVAIAVLFMASNSFATTCNPDYFTLDWISLTPEFDGYPTSAPPPYEAYNTLTDPYGNLLSGEYFSTECVGVLDGNDDAGGLSEPSPNIGHLGDGLLNGQYPNDPIGGGC